MRWYGIVRDPVSLANVSCSNWISNPVAFNSFAGLLVGTWGMNPQYRCRKLGVFLIFQPSLVAVIQISRLRWVDHGLRCWASQEEYPVMLHLKISLKFKAWMEQFQPLVWIASASTLWVMEIWASVWIMVMTVPAARRGLHLWGGRWLEWTGRVHFLHLVHRIQLVEGKTLCGKKGGRIKRLSSQVGKRYHQNKFLHKFNKKFDWI